MKFPKKAAVPIILLAMICLSFGWITFTQHKTLEDILDLQSANGHNIEYMIHCEDNSSLLFTNPDPLPDEFSSVFTDVALTVSPLPKQGIVNGKCIMVYITIWRKRNDWVSLPELEIIVENNSKYFIKVGGKAYNVASGTEVLESFFNWVSSEAVEYKR